MSKESNPFDELLTDDNAEALKQHEDNEEKGNRLDYLIHRVFEQTEEGKELIGIWKESLIMNPGADEGMDLIGVGMREGMKRVIRNILLTVKRVEGK